MRDCVPRARGFPPSATHSSSLRVDARLPHRANRGSCRGGDNCPTPAKVFASGTVRERAAALCAAGWGRMSNHWEPSTRHPRPAARPQRASWTQDHSGLSLVLTLVWERRCPRWRKTRQTICSLRTTTLGTDAPGANASPFTSVPLISPVRAIPALPPRQPLDCCGLPGRSDRGRVVRPGGGPPLIAGRAAAHPHQQRAQCHGPPRPRFGQLTRLCRCVPEPLPLSPGLPHPISRCWIRVPAAPIACLTDRGACACQQ